MRIIAIFSLILFATTGLNAVQPDSLPQLDPGHPLAKGQQYLARKHYLDAADFYRSMAKRYQGTAIGVEARYYEAECYRLAGKYSQAIAAYRRLQQAYPFSSQTEPAQFQIAWCYAQQKSALNAARTVAAVDLLLRSFPETTYRDQALALKEEAGRGLTAAEKLPAAGPEATFTRAKEHFERRKYLDAMEGFKDVIYNYPGTRLAAEATFFLGECYFRTKDYQAAIDEYNRLLDDYPTSAYVDRAQFMIASAYFKQSPHYALDQKETTERARTAIEKFLEAYPQSPLISEARSLKIKIEEKLAHKEYDAARLYLKMKNIKSAKIYFNYVLTNYPETTWAAKSREALEILDRGRSPKASPEEGSDRNAPAANEK
jgi:outer membrane assembly lipoprotein YfiO